MGTESPPIGSIGWIDLTVADAVEAREFYRRVVGWESQPVEMGTYQDFCMVPPGHERPVAGICHSRGVNADLPPVWLVYITVADLSASMERCRALGGEVIVGPRDLGTFGQFCVIRDPTGAGVALIEPPR